MYYLNFNSYFSTQAVITTFHKGVTLLWPTDKIKAILGSRYKIQSRRYVNAGPLLYSLYIAHYSHYIQTVIITAGKIFFSQKWIKIMVIPCHKVLGMMWEVKTQVWAP